MLIFPIPDIVCKTRGPSSGTRLSNEDPAAHTKIPILRLAPIVVDTNQHVSNHSCHNQRSVSTTKVLQTAGYTYLHPSIQIDVLQRHTAGVGQKPPNRSHDRKWYLWDSKVSSGYRGAPRDGRTLCSRQPWFMKDNSIAEEQQRTAYIDRIPRSSEWPKGVWPSITMATVHEPFSHRPHQYNILSKKNPPREMALAHHLYIFWAYSFLVTSTWGLSLARETRSHGRHDGRIRSGPGGAGQIDSRMDSSLGKSTLEY